MAVTLCFSTVPMTALAQEADATTEQETTVPETSPEPQSDVTVYEADNSGEDIKDISGGDAGADSAAQGTAKEKDAAVQAVQALIDALPETVTEENAESVGAQLEAIAEAMDSLTEEQIAELDMTRLNAISEAMNAPMTVAAQDGTHADHPICGTECTHTDGEKHAGLTWKGISSLSDIDESGNYYLVNSVELDTVWVCRYADVTLCLNGYTITGADGTYAIGVGKGASLAITDCGTNPGKITHKTDATGENNGGIFTDGTLTLWNGIITGNTDHYYGGVRVFGTDGTFIMNGGSITGNTSTSGYRDGGGVYLDGGTFTMNGGTITGNTGGVGGVCINGTFTMTGGDITGNTGKAGGGVCLDSGTFAMEGGSITGNTGTGGGGVYQAGGTFTMTGGDITGNKSTSSNTGGGVYVTGGNFTMDGGKIAENEGPCGGVYVRNGGTFTLNQGIITENKNTYTYSAAGVYVAGTFTMTGGSISKNTNPGKEQSNGGGGVYVSGKFIMTGGEITGNETIGANGSGGVYVHGTFTMTGGSIKGNKSSGGSASSGGVFVGRNCTFNMEEGTIADNENTSGNYSGGGVYIDNGNFTLTGGTISGNTSASNGGGVYLNGGTFTMKGGKISNNKTTSDASYGGGGVYADGTFIMNDGEISGNASASSGGGVYLDSDSFTMNGGKISGNTSASNGGGVYLRGGTVAMTGGAITGNNTTTSENNCSGGVYVYDYYSLTMSGTVRITDNYKNGTLENGVYVRGDNGTDGNVYLSGYQKITIGAGGLTKEAQIGVSISGTLPAGRKSIIAKNANDSTLDYTQIFKSDMAGQGYVVTGPEEGMLYLYHVEHPHSWKYALKTGAKDTIVAVCDCGVEGGSLTLKAPAADTLTYDGTAKSITLDGRFVENVKTPTEADVTYRVKDGDVLESAPVNAGTYTASITCIGADDKSVTASVEYTIEKATLKTDDFTVTSPANLVYDGEAKCATVSSAKFNKGYIHVEYEDVNGTLDQATKAGTYKVLVTAKGDPNYNEASQLRHPAWTFTIQKAKPVIQLTAARQTLVKNGKEVDISKWVTFNNSDSDAKLTYELVGDYTGITLTGNMLKAEKADDTATNFHIRVTAAATDNFEAPDEQIIPVTVVDKMDIGIVFKNINISEPPTVTYGDSDFCLTAALTRTVPDDDNGKWNWESSDNSVLEIVSGADSTTPTIRVKKAGGSKLTVAYTSDTYKGSAGVYITVDPKEVTADMIADIPAQEYAARDIEPAPEVRDDTATLTSGTDFTYSYSDNFNAGTATLTITGKGNYTGTADKTFTISPKPISGAVIELNADSLAYNGTEQMVNIASVKLEGWSAAITYKIVSGVKATNANDSITLTISGRGNYTGTATTTWKITRIDPKPADFDVTPGLPAALIYDGTARTMTVKEKDGINGMGNVIVKYNGSTQAPVNAGSYVVTFDVDGGTNYNARTGLEAGMLTINKAAAPTLADRKVNCKYTLTGGKTVDLADLVTGTTGYTLGEIVGNTGIISDASVDATGTLKYTLTGKGNVGDTVTLPVTITSINYEDAIVNVVITMAAKGDQTPLSITGDNTVVYGQTLTLGTTGGSGTGAVTYHISTELGDGAATIEGNILTAVKVGAISITATKAADADYLAAVSAPVVIIITQAASTGEPKYTVITTDGKTLADAGLTLTDSTIFPVEGTLEWIDSEGEALSEDTVVEVNKTYKWCFTPKDGNYAVLTGEVELYHVDAPVISSQPESASVKTGEKATFEVSATGTDLTYQWMIDRNDGNGFVAINGADGASYTTGVTDLDCNGFRYYCIIRNAAGSVTTDIVTLTVSENIIPTPSPTLTPEPSTTPTPTPEPSTTPTPEPSPTPTTTPESSPTPDRDAYKIIEGADSKWTQNTDGALAIRGDGEIAKFQSVKVDGNVIDPSNYTVTEGSTIITLKADYLKTLSEGSHTFELVWTDGSATTNFTIVAKPDNRDNNNDSNDDSENDITVNGNVSSGNNTVPAVISAPKTGDASGIWMTLFAVSLAGLAAMLVRKKNNRE